MTIEAIKEAIGHLPDKEKSALAAWIAEQDTEAWDRQIEEDFSENGLGLKLLEQWDREIEGGTSMPLEDFFAPHDSAKDQMRPGE